MGNTNFPYGPGSDNRAVATEFVRTRDWTAQVARLNPLLAAFKDKHGSIVKRGDAEIMQQQGAIFATHPLLYDELNALTESNYGRSPLDQQVVANPTVHYPQGVTHARFRLGYFETAIGITPEEKRILENGKNGNIMKAKEQTFMIKHAKLFDDMLMGSSNASETRLLGLQHLLSTSNTVGEINQSTYSWWRANVAAGSSTTLPETDIVNMIQSIEQVTTAQGQPYRPDMMLLSNLPGGFNVYGKVWGWINAQRRFTDANMKKNYGHATFSFMGIDCFQNTKVGGQVWALCTDCLYFLGDETPKDQIKPNGPTMTEAMVYSTFNQLTINMCAAQGARTGYTA